MKNNAVREEVKSRQCSVLRSVNETPTSNNNRVPQKKEESARGQPKMNFLTPKPKEQKEQSSYSVANQ
jgi:hypothetical protein